MSISFYPYVKNESSQRFEFPTVCMNNEIYEINLCNANAYDILQTLGLPTQGEPVAIGDFARLLSATLRKHIDRKSPEIPPSEDRQPGRSSTWAADPVTSKRKCSSSQSSLSAPGTLAPPI
jgi:hypothetical protein